MTRLVHLGATLALCMVPTLGVAKDEVTVKGSETTFKKTLTRTVGKEKAVKLALTGVALREKAWFNVYAIASYAKPDAKVKTASALAKADAPKVLLLVMERDVDGEDMASAFKDAIRANCASGFKAELKAVNAYFKPKTCKTKDRIAFVHLPGVGLRCEISGVKTPLVIKNLEFGQAMWEVYLGKQNVGAEIKQGLTKLLK